MIRSMIPNNVTYQSAGTTMNPYFYNFRAFYSGSAYPWFGNLECYYRPFNNSLAVSNDFTDGSWVTVSNVINDGSAC